MATQFTPQLKKRVGFMLVLSALGIAVLAPMAIDFVAIYGRDVKDLLASTDVYVRFNLIEASLWVIVGICFAVKAVTLFIRALPEHWAAGWASAAFVGLGVTDAVEARTRAWWRPPWLLFWKLVCIFVLGALILRSIARHRARQVGSSI